MSKWVLLFLLVCSTAQAQGLSARSVVDHARASNATLKAAMLQLESARWDLLGSESEYDPVLGLNASGQQNATSNVFGGFGGSGGGSVRINTIRRIDYGASLSKHLIWGTDLTLTLSSYAQWSRFSGGGLGLPSTGTGTNIGTGVGGTTPLFAFGNFGPVYNLTAKLALKQPLWRGRGRDVGEANRRIARATRTQTEHTRDRVGSELLRDVLTASWELWYADATVSIQQQAREVATRQRDEADARARSGSLAPAEVLTFETQVATSDQDVLNASVERATRVHELERLVGDAGLSFDELSDEPPAGGGFSRKAVEEHAVSDSLEVREKVAAVQVARIQQKTADDPKKPQLDLDSYVQTQGIGLDSYGDSARQFVGGDVVSGFVGLTYSAPVNDRVRRAEAAKARLATEIAEQHLYEAKAQVLSEVRGALDREAAGEQKVALAERTVSIAERQLAAEQSRYQSGSSTPIAVLEAQNAVRTAKLRLARARADWAESALILDHLSGGLLARYVR
ncbi:MAG: TolC family protein [Polyangiales bacterium]